MNFVIIAYFRAVLYIYSIIITTIRDTDTKIGIVREDNPYSIIVRWILLAANKAERVWGCLLDDDAFVEGVATVEVVVVVADGYKLYILAFLHIEALGLKLRDSIVDMPRGINGHIEVDR